MSFEKKGSFVRQLCPKRCLYLSFGDWFISLSVKPQDPSLSCHVRAVLRTAGDYSGARSYHTGLLRHPPAGT